MALYRTGSLILNSIKPFFVNPCFIVPSSVNIQIRHAARKGYRNKSKKQKVKEEIPSSAVTRDTLKLKRKYLKIEKTLNLKKPEPPSDDVFIMGDFNYKKFSLSEAVKLHREYHHPTVYNNPEAPVTLKIEVNMTGKSQFQFLKPFSGVAAIPHSFLLKQKKEILVLCSPEHEEMALSCGASVAGGTEVVNKILEGLIQPVLFDYVIAHVSFLPHLTPIRNLLKHQLPRAKKGTLTNDLKSAILRFLHGIEYSCLKMGSAEDFGFIDCTIGKIDMELDHLEENLKALISDIEKNKPPRKSDFITWIWCLSPPSEEEFSVDVSRYVKSESEEADDFDDFEEVEVSAKKEEREADRALARDYRDEELMG